MGINKIEGLLESDVKLAYIQGMGFQSIEFINVFVTVNTF